MASESSAAVLRAAIAGGSSFRQQWPALTSASRLAVLTTAKELLKTRTGTPQRFDALLPELASDKLGSLAEDAEVVPRLMEVRLDHTDACTQHDQGFVGANASGMTEEQIAGIAAERGRLMCTLLSDVVTVTEQTGATANLPVDAAALQAVTAAAAAAPVAGAGSTAPPAAGGSGSGSGSGSDAPSDLWRRMPQAAEPGALLLRTYGHDMPEEPAPYAYADGPTALLETTLAASEPIQQYLAWHAEAVARGAVPADGQPVCLATSTADGRPSSRMVIMKHVDDKGFVFFTNLTSRKGQELASNPTAAILVYWLQLNRQVRIEGRVERVTAEESDAYYNARPRGSRVAAWASDQSRVVPGDRSEVERRVEASRGEFADEAVPVPRPAHWGGVRLVPERVEFWANGQFRIHDRLVFSRGAGGEWGVDRLFP